MPEAEFATHCRHPVEAVWEFVREMDRWAPLVTGYQSHEKLGPDDSLWVLKGDVGVLSRTVKLRVHVTDWAGPERVAFTLAGVNEPLAGEGCFRLEALGDAAAAPLAGAAAPRRGALGRLLDRLVRWALRRQRSGAPPPARGPEGAPVSRLCLRLRLDPGGPMAPMLSALIAPALEPAAEALARGILNRLDGPER